MEYFCEMYRSIKLDLHHTGRYWIPLLLMHRADAVWFTSLHCTGRMWNVLLPYTALVDIGSLYYYYTGWMQNVLLPYTALVDIGSLYYYYTGWMRYGLLPYTALVDIAQGRYVVFHFSVLILFFYTPGGCMIFLLPNVFFTLYMLLPCAHSLNSEGGWVMSYLPAIILSTHRVDV